LVAAVDAQEQSILRVLGMALGTEEVYGQKRASRQLITELRAKKFRVALGKGKHSRREQFMLDEDALLEYSKANTQDKVGEKYREAMKGFRDVQKQYELLDAQLKELNIVVEGTNAGVIDFGIAVLSSTGELYARRRRAGGGLTDGDYERIAGELGQQRRIEAMSAIVTGLMTAYHASIRDGKNPKLIDDYVNETLKAFPVQGKASSDDAHAFVQGMFDDLDRARERYHGYGRVLYGEDEYASRKAHIDEQFEQVAQNLKAAPRSTGSSAESVARVALGSGSALSSAERPVAAIDHRVGAVVNAATALQKGDVKGALVASASLVPEGPAKQALSLVLKFF
jgi:hypothetical protein